MLPAKRSCSSSEKYGLKVDPDALVSDISVGMQQRVEILKMLYRDNEILIFDEPTAVLTPQEIDELMEIMRGFKAEGKSILFITHKLNEIMAVADRCTVLQKGRGIGTVDIANTTKEELSRMMVGRDVQFAVDKAPLQAGQDHPGSGRPGRAQQGAQEQRRPRASASRSAQGRSSAWPVSKATARPS